jgi:PAS domain S-box-containing protein
MYSLLPETVVNMLQDTRSQSVILGDIYLDNDSTAQIEILVPIAESRLPDSNIIGWIILRINPETDFFPLIKTIPIPFETLDVDLVRPDNGEVVFLNKPGLPRIQIDTKEGRADRKPVIESLAISGFRGTVEGTDSRGKDVIAAIRPIQEGNYFLIVKKDVSEAFAGLNKIRIAATVFALLIMIALTSSVLLFWSRQKSELESLELKQSLLSEQYEWLSQYANDIILLFDQDLKIIQVNDKALLKYGYNQEELLNMTIDELWSPSRRDELRDMIAGIIKKGGQRYESIHRRKDGSDFPVEESIRFISVQGRDCFQSIIRDISERKRIERALLESEERMRLITNSLPQIVWTAKPDGSFDYFNSRFEMLTGLLPLKESSLPNSIHAEDLERIASEWNKSVREGSSFQSEFRLKMKDGSYRWFLGIGIPFHDEHGNLIKWFGSATDVDDLKGTERELHRRELLLRNAVNNLPSSFTVYDDQGRIEYINDFSLVRSDITAEEAIGKREEEIFPAEVTKNYLPVLVKTYKTKEPQVIECLIDYADAPRYVIYHFVPTLDENNNIYKVLGMAYDITERKNSEEKLKAAIRKAEESDRLKSAFLANISHEIRTPLNAIMGFSQMIQKTFRHDDQLNNYVEIIITSAQQLLDIIKQIIEISQLESGGSNVNMTAFSLTDLLQELYKNCAVQENEKIRQGLEFKMDIDKRLDDSDRIVSDRDKLSSVIRNLLSNAFKFTRPGGSISFGCNILGSEMLQFFVKDNGIGIEEGKQEVIFNAFRQADETYTRNFGGVGLGLAICRNLVGILGGKIWVDSKQGKGSIFYFTIPYRKNQE